MTREDIVIGGLYKAKVSKNIVTVRVESINKREGNAHRRAGTTYSCTNLDTGREITIKSAAKFRCRVNDTTTSATHDDLGTFD